MNILLNFFSIYFLSVIEFIYIFFIILNFKLIKFNKTSIVFLLLLLIILSDRFISKYDLSLYIILISIVFFIMNLLTYKEIAFEKIKIYKLNKDINYFVISSIVIFIAFIITKFILNQGTWIVPIVFLFQLSLMIAFIYGFLKYYIYFFKGKIIKNNLYLFFSLLGFIILSFYYANAYLMTDQNIYEYLGLQNLIQKETITYYLLILKNIIYIYFIFYSLIIIIKLQNSNTNKLIAIRSSSQQEFNILAIVENLVLQSDELTSTLENILHMGTTLTKSDGGIIYLFDKEKNEFICKRIYGYFTPTFIVNNKIFENINTLNNVINEKNLQIDSTILIKSIVKNNDVIKINTELEDESRNYLSDLKDYAYNIEALIANKIMINNEMSGLIIFERGIWDYTSSEVEIFKAVCSISGVIINSVQSKILIREKERLTNEMKIAEKIQTSILPRTYNLQGYKVSAFMRPAEEVGGDYYDIINGPDGMYWINIGDVTGHGVTAGLIMMMLETITITLITNYPKINPRELTIKSNQILYQNLKDRLLLDQYITTCFIKFNQDGLFEYAGAHEAILIYRKATNKISMIETKGVWLGLLENISSATPMNKFKLEKDDVLLLFTDGVIELKNKQDEQFDIKRLAKFLLKNAHQEPNKIAKLLINELDSFSNLQLDDITYVILKKE